jgi:nicotinate phosphoribosyltransferase
MPYLEKHVGLYTDRYELTMAQAHYFHGRQDIVATFDYFFRKAPYHNSYVIFAGLTDFLETLEKFSYESEELEYLHAIGFSPDFLDYLAGFRFQGKVYAPREGDLVFPGEPVVRVEGTIIETQIIETLLLNILNFQSLIATKASRLRRAAGPERTVIDFGLRRAQGLGGIHASKASIVGGVNSTSNVYAGFLFDIPSSGTQAHAWIQSYTDEYESFRDFAQVFPENCTLLVDTYDTLKSGVPHAILVAKEMEDKGQKLFGIRLDSGDPVYFSQESRKMLDKAGLDYVKIVVSNELDEHVIEDILAKGAPIDAFGVGTHLITGLEDAALDGVYKICKSGDRPCLKLSENEAKIINPDRKNIIRYAQDGHIIADGIYLENEDPYKVQYLYDQKTSERILEVTAFESEILLQQVMDGGIRLTKQQSLPDTAEYVVKRMEMLPEKYKTLHQGPAFPVGVSKNLLDLRSRLIQEARDKIE